MAFSRLGFGSLEGGCAARLFFSRLPNYQESILISILRKP
jgi:hypothetical protein